VVELGDVLHDALELADWTWRYEMPDLAARADAIKAQPGWKPFAKGLPAPFNYTGKQRECVWCGNDFPSIGTKQGVTCGSDCSKEYRRWKAKRR
jgi:hypothetical protein